MRTGYFGSLRRSVSLAGLAGYLAAVVPGNAADWPHWLGPHGDLTWREDGLVEKFGGDGPRVVWRAPLGNGYSGPAVAGDRVVVMDYQVKEGTIDANPGGRTRISGTERVVCLRAGDGGQVWVHEWDSPLELSFPNGPRCTPTIDGNRVYALGAEGRLWCLSFEDGKPLWDVDFRKAYGVQSPMWGYASHPLVHGDLVYVKPGGSGTAAVALDKRTGREVWRALDSREAGYAPPVIIRHGGKEQLLIWHGEAIASLDPLTGRPYWVMPYAVSYGMAIMAPRLSGDYLFIGGIVNKSRVLRLKPDQSGPEVVWDGTPKMGLTPKNGTPVVVDDIVIGCDADGDLRCFEIETGRRLWSTEEVVGRSTNSATFFPVKTGSGWVIFNDQGELILADINREGYRERSRARILEPLTPGMGRKVIWSHPAFAHRCVFARNDREIVCISLEKKD